MDPRFIKLYFKSIKRRGKGETKKEERKNGNDSSSLTEANVSVDTKCSETKQSH